MNERKQTSSEELEQIRQELTEQLIHSERMRSLGTLSGGVAHHFNNLLSVILGYTSLVLNREELSDESNEALQKVCDAAQRGRRLTEELLAFGGSEVEDDVPCHVHDTLSSVLSLLQSQVHSRVQIKTQLDAPHDEIIAPQSSVHQVVFNLLTNALDSTPPGGELCITTSNEDMTTDDGEQECLRIEVVDSGGSVPEDFEPPESYEAAIAGDDFALKLSSIYGIVGKLDGTVLASPEAGGGARVTVVLPTTTKPRRQAAARRTSPRTTPSTIWVVDDDPIFREMCHSVLSEQGHQIEELGGGKEMQAAWSKAKARPDLIIVDFSMPEYNGLELCQWLREQGSHVPVVLVSGLSHNQPDIRKALDIRRTFFLQKPFSFRELEDVVTVAMGETLIGE